MNFTPKSYVSNLNSKSKIFYLIAEFDLLRDQSRERFGLADKMRETAEQNLPDDEASREHVLLEKRFYVLTPEGILLGARFDVDGIQP